jgi:hypothetical protein
MQFLRRNRFPVVFLALLVFCGAMAVRQLAANKSKHVELREAFILLYSKGYRPEADQLLKRLLRDLEGLPNKALMEDYERTLILVDPIAKQPDNLIWRYHWTVSNEIEKRSLSTLVRARKLAEEEQ